MTYIVSITDFRNNIAKYTKMVDLGHEVIIEKENQPKYKVIQHTNDSVARAKKMLCLLPKLKGILKSTNPDYFRGPKELLYMKKLLNG